MSCVIFCYCLLGDHCEKCLDGWYGNATNATPNDCSPCPCPSGPFAVNQFAKTCVLSSDGLPTCVNCTVGHEGRYCERCMDGYFGRPRVSVRLSDMLNPDKRHSYVVKTKDQINQNDSSEYRKTSLEAYVNLKESHLNCLKRVET